MAFTEKTVYGYTCERCGNHVEAESPWADDYPEGYFVTMRRVTEAQNHSASDLLFFDTKECLVAYVQYGISASTSALRPIARPETAKKRSDRLVRQRYIYGSPSRYETPEEARARVLPTLGPTGSIPLDPDRFPPNPGEPTWTPLRFHIGDWVTQVAPEEVLEEWAERGPALVVATGRHQDGVEWIDLGAGELYADAFEKVPNPQGEQ